MNEDTDDSNNSTDFIDHTDAETLRRLYWDERKSTHELADMSRIGSTQIRYWMDKHGIERRHKSETKGRPKINRAHFGTSQNGYETWTAWDSEDYAVKRVKVHRLLAVAKYGYDEVVDKVVHHKNRVKWDNRSENIEIMTNSEHVKLHRREDG